jgi:hypothetical protein
VVTLVTNFLGAFVPARLGLVELVATGHDARPRIDKVDAPAPEDHRERVDVVDGLGIIRQIELGDVLLAQVKIGDAELTQRVWCAGRR